MLHKTRVELTIAVIVESEGPLDAETFVQELNYEIEPAVDHLNVISTEIRDYEATQLEPVDSPLQEHDEIRLLKDLAFHGLKAGAVGTIVHPYTNGAYEVEFLVNNAPQVVTVNPDNLTRHQSTAVHDSPCEGIYLRNE